VTAHRRESFGAPLKNICGALREIAAQYAGAVTIVFPVHLNPHVQNTVKAHLKGAAEVILTPPLDYALFVQAMKRCYCILTDSGGIQEEAPSLGKPVLILREVTERPEAVAAGAALIVGTKSEDIAAGVARLLKDRSLYSQMSSAGNPYGDGNAGKRIVARLLKEASAHA
jgi:UDP-N-acetylglucosamine 2-epimerase (non-hydrolysing)